MSFSLTSLPKIKRNSRIRVGRGIGSGKGKTSGRGVKGQKARTGHHSVKGFEGGQTPVYMRLPKKGFTNVLRKEIEVVNIADILQLIENKKLDASADINKEKLQTAGLIKNQKSKVKLIMGKKEVSAKLKIVVDAYSKKAKAFSV
ncbi:MAG: 50S ribosomal protein L15 [Alphaproteobacteria bacterium RIFCSPLOWO2_01_FULL_40_26]|nr:MAG: 50S ribosomal protein L15 [Alphaproteobacteria bacterium RIFCSPHIGHO2_02_FULL_40_34]OFW87860.1 MAG: 50S ribosomal protein L15 [Alphaproteobacteria bacterium RIFCSPHIGHO2_01_FULL_40_8]OFW95095.1 MAG: 50S ribosomal protein L15 [Alphaproteobacteria bacterium RIFCSPLOWO2_01_FULL_40_26]OFX09082.1 MAG: 50S ribosomal protein L15 [Alphaproteobacteria bacterium RIFCSPLOWO2_02_FULL_40_19]OFX12176.1 MAG: 50S ribosomal protein L15 [Alphaproteobacteria bacterium RIFCSPLOWO2_12_FULL_40_11]